MTLTLIDAAAAVVVLGGAIIRRGDRKLLTYLKIKEVRVRRGENMAGATRSRHAIKRG